MIFIKRGTIEEFAKAYNLAMEVSSYSPCIFGCRGCNPTRSFRAHFADCIYIKGPEFPIHTVGKGKTEEEAVANYASKISGGVLMFDDQRLLLVWELV